MRTILIISYVLITLGFLTTYSSAENKPELKLKLKLENVVEIALKNNLNLQLERISPKTAKEQITAAQSSFDPVIGIDGSLLNQDTYDETENKETLRFSAGAGLSKKFKTGTSLSVDITRMDSDTENYLGQESGGDYTKTTLTITQPLMKNLGTRVNLRDVTLAENNYKIEELALKQVIIDTVSQSQKLYWDYYSAQKSLEVFEKSLGLAKQFLLEVEEKVKVGSAARLDTLQAKAEAASREEGIITAKNTLQNALDSLTNYIYGDARFHPDVTCLTKPFIRPMIFKETDLTAEALKSRTDLLSAGIDLESDDVDLLYYENRKRPDLNLTASFGVNEGNPDSRYSASDEYKNYYSGELSVRLSFPWGLRGDKANYAAAKFARKQAKISMRNIETRVVLDVRTALRDLRAAQKSYEATKLTSQYAEEALRVEEAKYKQGLSTSYNVFLFQRDLIDAQVNEVDAVISYQAAQIDLYSAVGNTLEMNNIKLKRAMQ